MERLSEETTELRRKLARLTVGRYIQACAKGNSDHAAAFVQAQNWTDRSDIVMSLKSATSDTRTSDLPVAHNPVSEAFLSALRPLSIMMRLEGMRRMPLKTRIFVNTQPIVATQFVPGTRIPVVRSDWNLVELELRSIGAITVVTKELLENESNAAQLAITDDLAAAVAVEEDVAFISPNEDGSILSDAPSFASSGSTVSDVDTDLRQLVRLVAGADRPGAAFVMSKTTATYLATLRGSGGAAAYPDLGPGQSGTLLKLPVLVSAACEFDDSPESGFIGLLNPNEIIWNEGDVSLSTSTNAALVMDSDPEAVTNPTSMFQADAVALKAVRRAAWYAKPGRAAYMTTAY